MLKPIVRLFSFFFKELSEVRRQPRLILSLLLGPFLILLLFGVGYQGSIPKFRVALVLPADTSLLPPQMVDELKKAIETNFILVSADANQDEALRKLQNGEVDVVELFPPDVSQVILRVPLGQQSPVVFRYSEVNPQNESWVKYLGYAQVTEINKQILMQIIAQAQKQSNAFPNVSPQAIVSPLEPQYENIRGQSLSFMTFYAPSVMALILQHIALTLGALALVRERLRGSFELFRVAPISINTILVGKYLAYILYVGIIAALLVGALVLMRTPFLGNPVYFAALALLVIVSSIGYGFLISAVSRSDSQAVQLSMLVLLLSIIFSGFFLPLDNFLLPVRIISYALPMTHGIVGFRNLMLEGVLPDASTWLALGVVSVLTFAVVWLLANRQLRRAQSLDA